MNVKKLIKKMVKGLEVERGKIYLIGKKEIYSVKHEKKFMLYTLTEVTGGKKNKLLFTVVGEIAFAKRLAEELKGGLNEIEC